MPPNKMCASYYSFFTFSIPLLEAGATKNPPSRSLLGACIVVELNIKQVVIDIVVVDINEQKIKRSFSRVE